MVSFLGNFFKNICLFLLIFVIADSWYSFIKLMFSISTYKSYYWRLYCNTPIRDKAIIIPDVTNNWQGWGAGPKMSTIYRPIFDIYHDIIMIFSLENIMIYINENINRILLWFTYFYNFDKFETPSISIINSIVVVVCWMLIAEPIIFF